MCIVTVGYYLFPTFLILFVFLSSTVVNCHPFPLFWDSLVQPDLDDREEEGTDQEIVLLRNVLYQQVRLRNFA